MGFGSLQHFEETRVHLTWATKPTSLRLQGLLTLLTFSSPRVPAGPISFRRRSWDSPYGAFPLPRVSPRSRRDEPTCRSPWGGLSGRTASCWKGLLGRLLGFDPGPSPSPICGPRPTAGRMLPWVSALLGFVLLQPGTGLRRLSSHVLGRETGASYRPHLRVSIGCKPSSSTGDEPTLLGFSHLPSPAHSSLSGLRAMCSPHSRHGIAAIGRLLFGTCRGLAGAGGIRCRCQSKSPFGLQGET